MMLASSFVVCRAGSVCRLPSAVPLPCCLMCVCRCMSDPSSASGAPQQNPSRACPRRASVECFSPRRAVALLLPLRVWVLSCLRVSLVCLESRVTCVPAHVAQSISCLTYILSRVFMLSVTRPLFRVHSIYVTMCMLQTSARIKNIWRARKCILYRIAIPGVTLAAALGPRR